MGFIRIGCLGLISVLLTACGGGENATDTRSISDSIWYETDFQADSRAAARHYHTVVLDLEPAEYIGEPLENLVRYELDAGLYRFCIEANDEFITGFTLENEAGEVVLALDQFSHCSELELPTGVYTKRIQHDGSEILTRAAQQGTTPLSRTAFVQAGNPVRLTGGNGQALAGWWSLRPLLQGETREHSFESTLGASGPDYGYYGFTISPGFFSLQLFLDSSEDSNPLFIRTLDGDTSRHSVLGLRKNPIDNEPIEQWRWHFVAHNTMSLAYDGCDDERQMFFTLAAATDCRQARLHVEDLGNYQFRLYFTHVGDEQLYEFFYRNDNDRFIGERIWTDFEQDASREFTPLTFQVRYRLFEPVDRVTEPVLQEGEVALFEQANYSGKMWIIGADLPDLRASLGFNNALGIGSIKVGPNTAAAVYRANISDDQPAFTNEPILIASNTENFTDCVFEPDFNCVRGLKVVRNTIEILISSKRCLGCNLSGLVVQGVDLNHIDLSGANLTRAQFNQQTQLQHAKFINATLIRTNFNFANLDHADFTGADSTGATLVGAFMPGAIFESTTLTGANFTQAHLYENANFDKAIMTGTIFNEALLFRSQLKGTLSKAQFSRAVLVDADFNGATLDGASFNNAWLQGATFQGVKSAEEANFTGACADAKGGTWAFIDANGVSRPVSYGATELGALATEAQLVCPNGDRGPCCDSGDLIQCLDSGKMNPRGVPQPPDCLPDPNSWDGCRAPKPDEHLALPTCAQ